MNPYPGNATNVPETRNHTNNDIRKAKRKYFNDKLDRNKQNPKAIWNLINDLYSRKLEKLKSVSEIEIGEQIITNATEIAEQFSLYFSNIGMDLGGLSNIHELIRPV